MFANQKTNCEVGKLTQTSSQFEKRQRHKTGTAPCCDLTKKNLLRAENTQNKFKYY